ncbi:tetraspanin-5 isoform X6 [Quercus robur]|uniref:tetraspanin-5 isoform X6 n=1 Tax=Quercus robur TaxID=38942 RepID=UPI0021614104|nr:tetraspanin-5 isoform X6 [Quercus robur]
MEVRPNPTADNASIPQPHHRHAVAAPPKQAANSPIPVDTSSVSQRLQKELMSLMSDCCNPPTSCDYNMATAVAQDPDCYHWNNAPDLLCYECDSCKAGVLENVRRDWHKLSVLNIVMLVFLIGIYSIGCCAFRNTKRAETEYPYGVNRVKHIKPRWDYHWWRWLQDKREGLY